jgi:KaiC/GvpD/RAD55 family RecA-like ATPase
MGRGAPLSSVVRIPRELQEFLNLPGPQTLLLRGPPGSGKTTLSLALLEAFKGDKILVTSRVPNMELHREFPWLGNNGGRSINVIDTSGMEESIHDVARSVRRSREYLFSTRQVEDREVSQFMWLPPPLQEAWSHLSDDKPSLVVIDSWDALVESFLGGLSDPEAPGPVPNRGEIERLLIRRMGKAPAHLAFVLEREDQTSLDYLVNGVVVTRRETTDQRLTRWMSLLKLRGVRIENPNYPFSLEGAKFEGILPLEPYQSLRPGAPDPETEPLPGFIWPGSRDFASSFGRLPIGKITLFEVDEDASADIPNLLCLPVVAHVLGLGGRVLLVPHTTENPFDIWQGINGSVPRARFVSHVRMLIPPGPVPKGREEFYRTVLPIQRPDPGAPQQNPEDSEAMRFLMEGATERSPGLIVVSLPGLIGIAQAMNLPLAPEVLTRFPDAFQTATKAGPFHMILVGRKGSSLLDPLRAVASMRLVMNIQQGRIFVHGAAPWTPKFVLAEGQAGRPYQLLRVV